MNIPALLSLTLLAATSLTATPSGSIAKDVFSDPVIAEVRKMHDQSLSASKAELQKSEDRIRNILAQQPENKMVQVYLGSLLTIKCSKAFPGPSKLRYLKEGLKMMDDAVTAAPDQYEVRFVRGVNNYQLPFFIGRKDNAREDFKFLMEKIQKPEVASKFDPETLQGICYFAGLTFKETKHAEDARAAWEKGLILAPSTDIASKITSELKKMPSKK